MEFLITSVVVIVVGLFGFYAGFVMGKAVERAKHMKAVQGGSSQSGPDPRPRSS